jgi:hypothetical protein
MAKIFYTDEEAAKLIDCEVYYGNEWRGGYKFLRRGINEITCLSPFQKDKWLTVKRFYTSVKVDGVVLSRIGKHSFTNPNRPFNRNL